MQKKKCDENGTIFIIHNNTNKGDYIGKKKEYEKFTLFVLNVIIFT